MSKSQKDTLDLSTFISNTLCEMVSGVEQARKTIADIDTNAEICPTGLHYKRGEPPAPFKPGRGFIQEVCFDVAVTVNHSSSKKASGKGELSIGVPTLQWLGSAGAKGEVNAEKQRERNELSRITFKVPVLLPSDLYTLDDTEQ